MLGRICKSKGEIFLKQKITHWKAALSVMCSRFFGQGNFFIPLDYTDQVRTMKDSQYLCHLLNLECVVKGHIYV